jgi:hypothetical protein
MITIDEFEKKLAELEDLHAELKTQIAELKAQHEELPKPPHPRWKPKDNELYYTNTGYGETCNWFYYSIGDDTRVIGRYSIGNVFRTEAEAEFAAERLKVLAEMREWAGNPNDLYRLVFDYNTSEFTANISSRRYTSGGMRFASRKDAENCIEAVGADRIKKYYFMIPNGERNDNIDSL